MAVKARKTTANGEPPATGAEHLAAMETRPAPTAVAPLVLPRLDVRTISVSIVGDSELIVHRWSEKAKKEILDKQMGIATAGKAKKDPWRDYVESMYWHAETPMPPEPTPDDVARSRFTFPSVAFKNAAVEACTSLGKSITKVAARQCFHVCGEFAEIHGHPRMREDMVRLNGQTADIRFRGGFPEWSITLLVRYNARVLTAEQVVNVFNVAGFGVGVGEWRSEKDGSFGLFHVQ